MLRWRGGSTRRDPPGCASRPATARLRKRAILDGHGGGTAAHRGEDQAFSRRTTDDDDVVRLRTVLNGHRDLLQLPGWPLEHPPPLGTHPGRRQTAPVRGQTSVDPGVMVDVLADGALGPARLGADVGM